MQAAIDKSGQKEQQKTRPPRRSRSSRRDTKEATESWGTGSYGAEPRLSEEMQEMPTPQQTS